MFHHLKKNISLSCYHIISTAREAGWIELGFVHLDFPKCSTRDKSVVQSVRPALMCSVAVYTNS